MDTSNLLHVPSAEQGGKEYWIDETNGVVLVKDGNGKLQRFADVHASNDGVQTRDLGAVDVHIPSALSSYAAGYKIEGGVAEIVAPVVMTNKASDYFFTFDKDDAFESASSLVQAEGDRVKEISPRKSNTLFTTVPYALGAFIPQGVIANADAPLNPRMAAISRVMNVMLLAREERTAAIFNLTDFAGYTSALGSTTKWNGGTSSDPKLDLDLAEESALLNPTMLVMNKKVFNAFARNPNISKYSVYKDNKNSMNPADLQAALDLPPIVIANMKGKSVSAGTYGYIWDNVVVSMHNQPGVPADQMTIGCAKTFRWSKGGLGMDANGFRVRMFFDPTRGQDGGEVIVVAVNEVPQLTGVPTSYLLTSVVI